MDRERSPDEFRLNVAVLSGYRDQLERLHQKWHMAEAVPLEILLTLPGVVVEGTVSAADAMKDWPVIRDTLDVAMRSLAKMREKEGQAMAEDLERNRLTIGDELEKIATRAPQAVESFRARLSERLKKVLAEFEVTLDPSDLLKEVAIFAERSDISEEIVRLRSHLKQFSSFMEIKESSGRKLEFLTQEMFREANTIGSKSGDVEIARGVIEIKAAIERIREMIQNIE